MSKLVWDDTGERLYETGVKNGVLYVMTDGAYGDGVAWNGLTTVTESPSGAEATALYADDIKYLNLMSNEEFGCTIEAYTYPDAFMACDGTAELVTGAFLGQQPRKTFGFCYRTTLGNDVSGNEYGYKIHIVYGCLAAPSEKAYATINDSPEAITFSWEVSTTPVNVKNHKPTATVVIDSSKFVTEDQVAALNNLLDVLYGTENTNARLPLPAEIIDILTPAPPPVPVAAPSIEIVGDTLLITDVDGGAEEFDIYVDGEYATTVAKSGE